MKYSKPTVMSNVGASQRSWCWFGYTCNNGTFKCGSGHKCIGTFSCVKNFDDGN